MQMTAFNKRHLMGGIAGLLLCNVFILYLTPFMSSYIQPLGLYIMPSHLVLWSHLTHLLPPVLILAFAFLFLSWGRFLPSGFSWFGKISWWEFSFWGGLCGVLACVPVIPLALRDGYSLGFDFGLEKAIGDIFSNTYEEVFYRGYLYFFAFSIVRNKWGAALVAACYFYYTHAQYPFLIRTTVFLASLLFSLAYLKTKNIATPILSHMVADLILDTILIAEG